ncbi:hypothetical protein NCH01_17220 [Neoasaia chiangmaiensis]|nr:hypothetical protein NCH01_17220 [Neoasaia chiangmaiensis]
MLECILDVVLLRDQFALGFLQTGYLSPDLAQLFVDPAQGFMHLGYQWDMQIGRSAQGAGLHVTLGDQPEGRQPGALLISFVRKASGHIFDMPDLAKPFFQDSKLTPQRRSLAPKDRDRFGRVRWDWDFLDHRVDGTKAAESYVLRRWLSWRDQTNGLRLAEHFFRTCAREIGELLALPSELLQLPQLFPLKIELYLPP